MRALWALGVLVTAILFGPTISALVHEWLTDTYAVHGMFVPLFSGYLAWVDRGRLQRTAARPSPAGLALVLAAAGLLLLARAERSLLLQGIALVVAVGGLVAWGFGWRCLRAAVFPVAFLGFMVPLPRAVVDAVSFDLQRFAAGFAALFLDLLGVPNYQSGIIIQIPRMDLEVAEICNGLRFMMALLVLAVAFAQVTQRSLPRKLIVAGSAIPLAILANALRVAVVAAAVHYIGPQAASGLLHHMIGKAVWAATLIPLLALGLALRRGPRRLVPAQPAEPALPPRGPAGPQASSAPAGGEVLTPSRPS